MKIYKLTNRGSSKSHIGKTKKSLAQRLHVYRTDARRYAVSRGQDGGDELLADIAKYGEQNLTIILLEECADEVADERRDHWIGYFNTLEPNGYNHRRQEPHP